MSHDDLTSAERAEIERVHGVLADRAVWAEPSPDLQERVVAAIAEEAGAGRRRRRIRYSLVAAAAAGFLAAGVTVGLQVTRDEPVQFAASLTGTRLAPDADGNVTLTKTDSGWKIELHATGLPRRSDGEFYQAWLKGDTGLLVPIGTFNEGTDVTLWSGVGPTTFPTLSITKEVADGNQASSGQVVLIGKANES
ncbi:MAG TPA: anti-sigma factor [Intrasporangium sp.]|jgi:hypothetical protein|uniref:anti-sigma factor n=1 Tax=Intrasporangium sp. TaxID=1925024 RepID=UPI002F94868A